MKIKIDNTDVMPVQAKGGDWIDVCAAEDVVMTKGDYRLISLGIRVELPEGYEAILAPRSSTFKNYGIILAGSIGVIDEDYNGDNDVWMFPALAMRNTIIRKGDRIAQFRLLKHQDQVEFEVVDTLGNNDRGGLGSTGR